MIFNLLCRLVKKNFKNTVANILKSKCEDTESVEKTSGLPYFNEDTYNQIEDQMRKVSMPLEQPSHKTKHFTECVTISFLVMKKYSD